MVQDELIENVSAFSYKFKLIVNELTLPTEIDLTELKSFLNSELKQVATKNKIMKKKKLNKSASFRFRCSEDTKKVVIKLAEQNGVSIAEFMRKLVDNYNETNSTTLR